mmetsp:Transcript_40231/g.49641  ORF Transcript_40231/g.49641 Transcript_40231/m.49641 type:complete len:151 (+) Transcript_40231:1-453(+)
MIVETLGIIVFGTVILLPYVLTCIRVCIRKVCHNNLVIIYHHMEHTIYWITIIILIINLITVFIIIINEFNKIYIQVAIPIHEDILITCGGILIILSNIDFLIFKFGRDIVYQYCCIFSNRNSIDEMTPIHSISGNNNENSNNLHVFLNK